MQGNNEVTKIYEKKFEAVFSKYVTVFNSSMKMKEVVFTLSFMHIIIICLKRSYCLSLWSVILKQWSIIATAMS